MSSFADPYPSRVDPEPRWLPRRDPVVWPVAWNGKAHAEGPLTQGQLADYERDGFLFFPGLFQESEIAALADEMNRLSRDAAVLSREGSITEPSSGDLRTVFEIHKASALFEKLAQDPRVAGAAEQLLGDAVYVSQSRLNYKPGFRAKEFYWHSDFETWHVEDGMPRMRALSISITLTENYAFNGPLMVIPGSHRWFVSCVGETPEDHYKTSLKRQDYGVPDDESLRRLVADGGVFSTTGKAGSVILFDCNIMHGSNSNITPFPRSNAFFAFNAMSNAVGAPFGGSERRPDFLCERHPYPVRPTRRAA
ncbi:MAG: ectoine hydroxylase [Kiloniellaceae bacterium]